MTHLLITLQYVKCWLDTNGLKLSVLKSTVVLFSRKRNQPIATIKYDNIPLPFDPQIIFLCIILDFTPTYWDFTL